MANIDPQTILNESREFVLELQTQVEDAINELKTFIQGHVTWIDFPPRDVFEPTPGDIIPLSNLPTLTPAVFGAEMGDPLSEIDRFYGHNFLAPMLDSMQNTLMGWITSGGVGISTDIQNALWENNRQRRLQSLRDVNDVIHSKDAARGFAAFTGGPTGRDEYNQLIEYQRNDENLNHEITFKMAELAQQNVQFAVTQNISIENIHAAFSQGMAGIFLNLKRLIIEKFKIEADQRIAEWRSKLDAILAGYEVAKVNGQLSVSFQELLTKQWEVLMVQGTERTKALIQEAEEQNKIQLSAVQTLVGTLGAAISSALLQTNGIVVDSRTSSGTTT
jgi:hypothetical protein